MHEGRVRVKVTKTDLDNSMKAERYDVKKKNGDFTATYSFHSLYRILPLSPQPIILCSSYTISLHIGTPSPFLFLSLYLYLYLSLSLSWDGGQVHAQMQACRRSKFAINDGSYPPGSPSRRAPPISRHQLPLLLP